jgi:hypothetical protein
MLVGLDYQTPEIIHQEFDALMALRPTLSQFLIYGPTPGTPLGERVEREGRLLPRFRDDPELRWRRSDGFTCQISHPHMSPEEIEGLQRWCYEEDYRRLGPAILRSVEAWRTGYEFLLGRPEPAFQRRVAYFARKLSRAGAIVPIARVLAPSSEVRRALGDLARRLRSGASIGERARNALLAVATFPAAAVCAAGRAFDIGQDPRCVRSDWSSADHPGVAVLERHEAATVLSAGEAA